MWPAPLTSSSLPVSTQARQNFGLAELDGMVYVMGGEDLEIEMLTVEVFDPHSNTWKLSTSMNMVRKVGDTLQK